MVSNIRLYNKEQAIAKMDDLGRLRKPFVFIIDYEMEKIIISGQEVHHPFQFNINGFSNHKPSKLVREFETFSMEPIPKEGYTLAFNKLQEQLQYGNSFLANLTFPSKLHSNLSLSDIYDCAEAKYKLHLPGQCLVFSPESFVQIKRNTISSYPMKGTIQANLPNAEQIILDDLKEKAEHSTIVDLIRNDLSMIATNVQVEKFRYVERIDNIDTPLLQVSSKITGRLEENFNDQIGSLLFSLLPAGSITGAPKKKTIEIIANAEIDKRGYYSGVFGYFDGYNLDSAVMIRYIEEIEEELFFRSGGGITAYSNLDSEYAELIDKIYVPLRKHSHTERQNLQSSLSSR